MMHPEKFDVIVVGGGHAGCEAAMASARMGVKTLLLTQNIETIGVLSCNVSVGGLGKSTAFFDTFGLGSVNSFCIDRAATNYKVLNRSKGPAVRAHHAILDRNLYRTAMRKVVENQTNLSIFQQAVDDILIENDQVVGVVTQIGIKFSCKAVIITTGTFLEGKIHVGLNNFTAGRAGDPASITLAHRLKELNIPQGRLKTGTPPRIDGRSIDFSKLTPHYSEGLENGDFPVFNYKGDTSICPKQLPCWSTRTTTDTHDILRTGFDRSPMFTGVIEGVGPRYCPSIEDKINRFADKDSHQIMLEPEGLDVNEYYPNGISTSLPFDVQYEAIRSIPGLENAHITRPGYAIEYNYFHPSCVKRTLELKSIKNVYFAGQNLSSSGYVEANSMGIVAGTNAALRVQEKDEWIPMRHESYLGVLIDDLTTKTGEIVEPYRLFTSRAEHRLYLREDNADTRMTPIGRKLGLVGDEQWDYFCRKQDAIAKLEEQLKSTWVNPRILSKEESLANIGTEISHEFNLADLIKRPGVTYDKISNITKAANLDASLHMEAFETEFGKPLAKAITEQVEIKAKYAGYINHQQEEVKRMSKVDDIKLPADFDYTEIVALSTEVKQKLNKFKPEDLGQASRISGIPPAAISIIMIYMKKKGLLTKVNQPSIDI